MKIKMLEKNEGHWIYRLLEAFGYTINDKSTNEHLLAIKEMESGVLFPKNITLGVSFYWDNDGMIVEVAAGSSKSLDDDGTVRDLNTTFIEYDMSGDPVDERLARNILIHLDEAAALYAKALRVANGQPG